ncbi:MAG: M36 family metallopeptidase [Deltaproteobacteria bacterium]|nr:M36 family metallopeptidase [Deltaproteobacteria bacterium]
MIALVLTACTAPTPEKPEVKEAPATGLEIQGPVTFVGPALRAQKFLADKAEVLKLRLDQRGELRTLALDRIVVSAAAPYDMALSALERYAPALGLDGVTRTTLTERFGLERSLDDDGGLHVRLRQMHAGVALDDRTIEVHFVRAGDAYALVHVTGSPATLADVQTTAAVDEKAALAAALARLPADVELTFSHALRFHRGDDGVYRLAHRIDAETADHALNRSIYVDAQDGHVLGEDDRVAQGKVEGFVFPENSTVSDRAWLPLANLTVSNSQGSGTTDEKGEHGVSGDVTFMYKGPFVEAIDDDEPEYVYHGSGNARLEFGRFDKKNSALAVFVHMNRMHDFFKARFGFARLDKVVKGYVHSEDCLFNAYAHGTSYLRFGDGCGLYDYAQSADYVFHEYTHLVTNSIVDVDYSTRNEAGAYSEGNSDYFACSALDNDVWGENPIGVFERPCNNDNRYEDDYSGESHSGAQIFSGSVWELRKQFGKLVADDLAYTAMFYMPKRPMLVDTRDALAAADRAKYAGAHVVAIEQAFDKHGVNDALQLFITSDNMFPKMFPFEATVTAHAQGFERATVRYDWEFSDGTKATGDSVFHRFEKKPATAKVTVQDGKGTKLFAEVTLKGCNGSGGAPWTFLLALSLVILRARRRR